MLLCMGSVGWTLMVNPPPGVIRERVQQGQLLCVVAVACGSNPSTRGHQRESNLSDQLPAAKPLWQLLVLTWD